MDENAYTIDPWPEPTEEELKRYAVTISSLTWHDPEEDVKATGTAQKNARNAAANRHSLPPRPYQYRGRKDKCFFPKRKSRWRKG